ncbi:YjjG family noncanonical pyrimidine nucleotidase, partial [Lachnospiraceae bacterium OttesenSCG-928-D06]|nr:YjjG family noncanonical pyrimidine nucleotidase [Lachnospiraceae bacterium OttesenSCG-928-D06]
MNKAVIKAILWDVDGTLLDFKYSQEYALGKCLNTIGISITPELLTRYAEINDLYWKRMEQLEITREELLVGRFLQLFKEYNIKNVDTEAFLKEYQEALGSIYSYLDDSFLLCKGLQDNYTQYIVTNGVASTQHKKLKLSGFDQLMNDIFISEEIGADKPSPLFFDYCFERIRDKKGEEVKRDEILIVGDSLTSDIAGGCQGGILTCWYNKENIENHTEIKADYEIQHLSQIHEII